MRVPSSDTGSSRIGRPDVDNSDVDGSEVERLRVENADLLRRVVAAEAAIDELRNEALERRQQIRTLVAELPVAMSRKTLLRQIGSDALRHPDKRAVVVRIINKMRRTARNTTRR